MHSIWSDKVNINSRQPLTHDIRTGVLIIGGGLAGILCAYRLKMLGIPCVIAEATSICSGTTRYTTAKITAQHGLIYHKIAKRYNIDYARLYLEAGLDALTEYEKLCSHINCDFEYRTNYVYSLNNHELLERELKALNTLGFPAAYTKCLPLPFKTAGAVSFRKQAQFNPLMFVSALIPELEIYENTRVLAIDQQGAHTSCGIIKADNYIVATHFPFINKHGFYYMKMYQHRSYVIAYQNVTNALQTLNDGMYVDESHSGFSFRTYKDMLLIGGGGHKTGKCDGGYSDIRSLASRHYPNANERYRYATQDCMTLDSIPYIGHYSSRTYNMYVATGFNKWGMTSSMTASMILADMIMGIKNKYAGLFSPSRTILHKQLACNITNAALNLLRPSPKRCPHLGCALTWNSLEKTWDCPCHGSRFTRDGEVINNPANKNLEK